MSKIQTNKNDWRFRGNETKYINQILKNGVKKIQFNKILEKNGVNSTIINTLLLLTLVHQHYTLRF